ncbi:MAG TPA: D-aminoacylase [Cyclobacteriaceae bacterium]|nr:D-aminoacylase [Cyclobacteriaceae bacterium]
MNRLMLLLLLSLPLCSVAQTYDLLIKNGKIIDGTGNSWYYGDIGIWDGKIYAIGDLSNAKGVRTLDAKGQVVAPGFIDVHAHIEGDELDVPTADNFIYDGVTTVVTGNCGGSNVDMKSYFHRLDSIGMSINVASLVGHNSVRRAVMGDAQRDPSADEQKQMEQLVEQAMKDGAVGLSTGLIYVPGVYSKTPEVIGLGKAASKYRGVYASHIRDEGDNVNDAIEEAVNIGRQANMPVEISHFKVTYKPNFGKSVSAIAQVEKARQEGIDVTVDQYPYVASSTTLDMVVPDWAFAGGRDSLYMRLDDPATRARIKKEMLEGLKKNQLKDYSYAVVARYAPDDSYNGKNISEINKMKGRKAKAEEEAETILEMIKSGRVQMVYFSMNEEDLQRIMKYPFSMTASDAGIAEFGKNMPHPRAYGTNARVLGVYVREKKVIGLEEAIRRMTSLPAQKFKFSNRGLLREGMKADIVVFDPNTVSDQATFQKPHAYSTGFKYVIVNGQVVIDEGKHNGARSGEVLLGPGVN